MFNVHTKAKTSHITAYYKYTGNKSYFVNVHIFFVILCTKIHVLIISNIISAIMVDIDFGKIIMHCWYTANIFFHFNMFN